MSTFRCVLHQRGLRGCCARKKPLLQTRHFKAWRKFAADHMDKEKNLKVNSVVKWNKMFCCIATMDCNMFGGEDFNPKNTTSVKHGGGSVMPWGCFAASGSASLKKVNGVMKKDDLQILQENLKSSTRRLGFGCCRGLQQDNNPKHK